LREKVGVKVLSQAMNTKGAMEQLAVLVHGQEDSSRMAGVMGRIEESGGNVYQAQMLNAHKWDLKKIVGRVRGYTKRSITIKKEQKKKNMMVGVLLLALLILGISIGVVRRVEVVKEREYLRLANQVESQMGEAASIGDLNPERAKMLLAQARGEIENYLEKVDDEQYRRLGGELMVRLDQTAELVFRQEEVLVTTLMELSILGMNWRIGSKSSKEPLMSPDIGSSSVFVSENKSFI